MQHRYSEAVKNENKKLTSSGKFSSIMVEHTATGLRITFEKYVNRKSVSATMNVNDDDETVEDFLKIYRVYADNAEKMLNTKLKTA